MIDFLLIQGGILRRQELTPAEKLVVCYLGFRQGNNGACWPPVELIAGELGLSRSTVKRSINKLNYRGYLIKYRQNGGKFQSNNYRVKMEFLAGHQSPDLDQSPNVRADDSLFQSSQKYRQSLKEKSLARMDRPLRHKRTNGQPKPLTYFGYIVPDAATWAILRDLHKTSQWDRIKEIQKGLKRVDESEATKTG